MLAFAALVVICSGGVFAQVSPVQLEPLLVGLSQKSPGAWEILDKRVPLSTNDSTVAPLIDLQVFAPPVVPTGGKSCQVELLKHTFGDGSYGAPTVVGYQSPTADDCGTVGQWGAITLNLSVYSNGTQYDRLGNIYLSHVEIWRTSSAEPTKTGTIWTTIKDVTHYSPLFAQEGELMPSWTLAISSPPNLTLTATFYAPTSDFPTPRTSDLIVPLSNMSPNLSNYFTIDSDIGGATLLTLPDTSTEAYVEIVCSGNSNEEFWYLNAPDEYVPYFSADAGIIGKGPFREVQVLIDGLLAGVVWPYAVIYTGGITPSNWRPLTSYGAYDAPMYWIDATPFLPLLLSGDAPHNITLAVVGQGSKPSINSNWFISGSVHVRLGTSKTTGNITKYDVPELITRTTGTVSQGNTTVSTEVVASRKLTIETELHTSEGTKVVTFSQALSYSNTASYADEGWIQWANQSTVGSTTSKHDSIEVLNDAFSYPIHVFSNYSLFSEQFGGYGSEINQTHIRALLPPTGLYKAIQSIQHAKGQIGMDDWPGLRHAINGTGATEQTFAYVDGRGQSYFRNVATKNDGWVRDDVWGTLAGANPPVPSNQIFGPGGGPGFRRSFVRRRRGCCP